MDRLCIRVGLVGTVIAAICCFTPVLVVIFGIAGLSAWLGRVDQFLLPLLGLFAVILTGGLVCRRWRRNEQEG